MLYMEEMNTSTSVLAWYGMSCAISSFVESIIVIARQQKEREESAKKTPSKIDIHSKIPKGYFVDCSRDFVACTYHACCMFWSWDKHKQIPGL
jgi:hypothetical protein